ncbi:MAG: hypothetical protein ACAH83_05905 [Alphaproteobacteria bacterium]
MTIKAEFNDQYRTKLLTPFVLEVSTSRQQMRYDFKEQMLIVSPLSRAPLAIPFSKLDPESLDVFREELRRQNGTPEAAGLPFPKGYTVSADGDYVLNIEYGKFFSSCFSSYDFLARIVTSHGDHKDGDAAVTLFSDMDPGVLKEFRQKLIGLGGHPPELPEAPGAAVAKAEKAAKSFQL